MTDSELRARVAHALFELGITRADDGSVPPELRVQILERDGHRCLSCGRYDLPLELDHVRPFSHGGPTIARNLQALCKSCNCRKGATFIDHRPR